MACSKTELINQYQLKKQRQHILDAPDTYIGGIEPDVVNDWTLDDNQMVRRQYTLIPGLYKCFDEGIVNCRDHFIRMTENIKNGLKDAHKVTNIEVSVNNQTGEISLLNDGDGIDIAEHPIHKLMIPEMIFGHLMTSTNYNKTTKQVVGGKNGFGFKLVLIFSKYGIIETVDHRRKLKYVQEFHDNLSIIKPPTITKCTKAPYTKVTFLLDYKRFGIDGITPDIFNLLKKRTYDVAGGMPENIRVSFNNQVIPVRGFKDYINLYIDNQSVRVYEKCYRWEYGVSHSPTGEFMQVSFVNGVYTPKGGKHVDHVMNQIIRKLQTYIYTKKKVKVSNVSIKEQLMIFINVVIENPSFDSQTKQYLNTPSSRFGSKCDVSHNTIEFLAKKMNVMNSAINLTQVKENNMTARQTDGSQTRSIRGIPKLSDANYAGTRKSHECVLILTEGDSAKAGVMSGLSKKDRNFYGIFPLKGKLMNALGESESKLNKNAEIANIKKIMGLKSGMKYNTQEDVNKHLRYGSVLLMTDQDLDGSHIKGLCINLFYSLWPELLKIPGFLGYMNTPIIKATRGKTIKTFYSEQSYHTWKKNIVIKGWHIKYFKGLGTSTAKEFKEYFKDKKIIGFNYTKEGCFNSINMAFNKKLADQRKLWLQQYNTLTIPGLNSSETKKSMSYTDFTNGELIHFSKYNCERSIPNLIDGHKLSQRKVLFACFKRNLVKEIKVAQLAGYVSEHAHYHHGEMSLVGCIVNLAQDYVGSNNINLLMPKGQFGTRLRGGKDSASERYIFTNLNPLTKHIYSPHDLPVLNYLLDDGYTVEPDFYVPIIPMILINGSMGIGTGFSCNIPKFNPLHIISYIMSKLKNHAPNNVDLFYSGYTGQIRKISPDKYLIKGKYEIIGTDIIKVTELPIGLWTECFKIHLESLLVKHDKKDRHSSTNKNKHHKCVLSYTDNSTDVDIEFIIKFIVGTTNNLIPKIDEYGCSALEKLLKLYTTKRLSNMYLFDHNKHLKKYDTIEEIIDVYMPVRLNMYKLRIKYQINLLEIEVRILTNKSRFIQEQCDNILDLRNKTASQVIQILKDTHYECVNDDAKYTYLRTMKFEQIETENINKLIVLRDKQMRELIKLKKNNPTTVWIHELGVLKKEYLKYLAIRNKRSTV
jgi:DNA topoisomerase-2